MGKKEFSMEDAVRFVNSPAGRQLLDMLQKCDDPGLRTAMEQAAKGDFTKAQEALRGVAAKDEVQRLLKGMGDQNG